MNLMAISGFRWMMEDGDMLLPVSSGYRVRIALMADDTYTVTREMKRGAKLFVKGVQTERVLRRAGRGLLPGVELQEQRLR